MLAINLPSEIENRLNDLANETKRTKTFYAREAIIEYLDDLEDIYLAEQRLRNSLHNHEESISLEEMMKRYGMEC